MKKSKPSRCWQDGVPPLTVRHVLTSSTQHSLPISETNVSKSKEGAIETSSIGLYPTFKYIRLFNLKYEFASNDLILLKEISKISKLITSENPFCLMYVI